MVGDPSDTTMAPEWWSRAVDDLQAAELLMDDGAPWLVAYHAQQAVEARTALETAGEAMGIVHDSLSRTLPDLPDPASPDTGSGGRTR